MTIYSIGSRNNIMLETIKLYFKATNKEIHDEIINEFKVFASKIQETKLIYNDFKAVLLPPTEKKKDYLFVFDTLKIGNSYGYYVFNKVIPCLNKDSKHNVLSGDLLDYSNGRNASYILDIMFSALNLEKINERCYTNRFYLVYINNISQFEIDAINKGVNSDSSFVGSCDMTYSSLFKSYSHL